MAIVSGVGPGLGRSIALTLARAGADVGAGNLARGTARETVAGSAPADAGHCAFKPTWVTACRRRPSSGGCRRVRPHAASSAITRCGGRLLLVPGLRPRAVAGGVRGERLQDDAPVPAGVAHAQVGTARS